MQMKESDLEEGDKERREFQTQARLRNPSTLFQKWLQQRCCRVFQRAENILTSGSRRQLDLGVRAVRVRVEGAAIN